jgi:hypothetical protein
MVIDRDKYWWHDLIDWLVFNANFSMINLENSLKTNVKIERDME